MTLPWILRRFADEKLKPFHAEWCASCAQCCNCGKVPLHMEHGADLFKSLDKAGIQMSLCGEDRGILIRGEKQMREVKISKESDKRFRKRFGIIKREAAPATDTEFQESIAEGLDGKDSEGNVLTPRKLKDRAHKVANWIKNHPEMVNLNGAGKEEFARLRENVRETVESYQKAKRFWGDRAAKEIAARKAAKEYFQFANMIKEQIFREDSSSVAESDYSNAGGSSEVSLSLQLTALYDKSSRVFSKITELLEEEQDSNRRMQLQNSFDLQNQLVVADYTSVQTDILDPNKPKFIKDMYIENLDKKIEEIILVASKAFGVNKEIFDDTRSESSDGIIEL